MSPMGCDNTGVADSAAVTGCHRAAGCCFVVLCPCHGCPVHRDGSDSV